MKKINFLGMAVPVMTEDDLDKARESQEPHVYMVTRIIDSDVTAGSSDLRARRLRTLCEGCNELCWLDPNGYDELRGVNLTILCLQCTLAKARREQPQFKPDPGA